MIGIYKITNTINGKIYIGKSFNLERRRKEHLHYHSVLNNILQRAIRKHGKENFTFEILETYENITNDDLSKREIYHISLIDRKKSYNATLGGEGISGLKFSKEHKRKIKEKLTNHIKTKEHCQHISDAKKERWKNLNETEREAIRVKFQQNTSVYTDERRHKLSEAGKKGGRKNTWTSNKRWHTNGTTELYVTVGEQVPSEFRPGRLPRTRKSK
jgi:group I intron endonuclease